MYSRNQARFSTDCHAWLNICKQMYDKCNCCVYNDLITLHVLFT